MSLSAWDSLDEELRPRQRLEFSEILSISAKDGTGIERLKETLRRKLDEIDELQRSPAFLRSGPSNRDDSKSTVSFV